MQHKTTAMELIVESTDLFSTLQQWAQESGFSLHEQAAHRAIYSKNLPGGKGWVSVEKNGDGSRVQAWQSSKSVGPDFSGNFWVGWKMPVPEGLTLGPMGVYKKQVNHLFALLRSKSGGVLAETSRPADKARSILNKSTLANGIAIYGVIELLSGVASLASASFISSYPSSIPGLANLGFQNGLHDSILGVLFIVCSRFLAKGKLMAIWLYGGSILLETLYGITQGHPLNYISLGFGLLFIWQMIRFRKEWNLA